MGISTENQFSKFVYLFPTHLPTCQDGVDNRDKVYSVQVQETEKSKLNVLQSLLQ